MKKYKDFIINTKDILSHINEAAYPGNIGMMEMMKFFNMASPEEKKEMNRITENSDWEAFKALIYKVTKVKLI